jgi:acetyl esterase/lipase
MQALYPLRVEPFETFAASWDSLRQVDEAALAAVVSSAQPPAYFVEMERARIQAVWAHGHLAYPVLNWRDGEARSIAPTPALDAAEAAVRLGDARRLVLPEFHAAARALVHEKARAMLQTDSAYQAGDNRWLRAKYDWIVANAEAPAVRDALLAQTVLTHLDQNGSENVEPLLARLAADVADPVLLRDVVRAYAEERRYWAGDRAETYKEVEGTTLEAHIERPAGADPDDRLPVFVWLHGGSFDTGAWYHCPFVCSAAREEGMAVVRLEQRSSDRFATTPADQFADVRDALAWVRQHADRLRLDPDRVVLGGFFSGATLAVMAATFVGDAVAPEAVPDAAVAIAACVAPLEGDGWFRASIAQAGDDPARFSPVHRVRGGAAPLLLVHGTDDEYCEYEPLGPYAKAMAAAGNDVAVETLGGQPHFFLFRSPQSRSQALDAIREFIRSRGLVSAGPSPAEG